MMYSLELGDWSDDGHGITKVFYVNIPDVFTIEQIAANHQKNVERFGFDYSNIAEEYEDSTISTHQIEVLEQAGLRFVYTSYKDRELSAKLLNDVEDNRRVIVLKEQKGAGENVEFHNNDNGLISFVRVIMFIIGDGIPGFTWNLVDAEATMCVIDDVIPGSIWKRVKVNATPLVGARSPLNDDFAGYGLFSSE